MLPLPAPRFELAVTPVVRVRFGLSKGSLFLLVGSACLRCDYSVLFEYCFVCCFLEFLVSSFPHLPTWVGFGIIPFLSNSAEKGFPVLG